MLREAGASYAEIGRAADLSIERVRQICRGYAYQLHRRSEYTSEEPFMARLRRAGALLGVAERVGGVIGSGSGSTPVELRFEPRSLVTVQPSSPFSPSCTSRRATKHRVNFTLELRRGLLR
jgi:hypothetical protein